MALGVFALTISSLACANKNAGGHEGGKTMPAKKIENVLKEHTEELMSIQGVVGTAMGLCNGKPCIKVYIIKKTSELDKKIPDVIESYPVSVEVTGEFEALPENPH